MELDIDAILAENFSQMNDQLNMKVSRAKETNKPHVSKLMPQLATSSAAINLMAEYRISYRKRRSLKPNVIPTTFSASNVRRTPKTKSKKRQTTAISKTKRVASKAAVTLEKLVRDKTLCKDIRKLSTQYQTSSIEPSRASIALLFTLLQRCMPFRIMACMHGDDVLNKVKFMDECFVPKTKFLSYAREKTWSNIEQHIEYLKHMQSVIELTGSPANASCFFLNTFEHLIILNYPVSPVFQ
ncbi:hypothetical protein LSAT2_023828 [Lamellibrachia satsuma]|nr:hypothetical protein LSAT2_023828 [Lamellibrachia satsuma]